MNYLHHEFDLSADDAVEVTLDNPANVRLIRGEGDRSLRHVGASCPFQPDESKAPVPFVFPDRIPFAQKPAVRRFPP